MTTTPVGPFGSLKTSLSGSWIVFGIFQLGEPAFQMAQCQIRLYDPGSVAAGGVEAFGPPKHLRQKRLPKARLLHVQSSPSEELDSTRKNPRFDGGVFAKLPLSSEGVLSSSSLIRWEPPRHFITRTGMGQDYSLPGIAH